MNALRQHGAVATEQGASSVEYGLLVAFIAAVLVVAVIALGGITLELFADTCTEMRAGIVSAGPPPSATC